MTLIVALTAAFVVLGAWRLAVGTVIGGLISLRSGAIWSQMLPSSGVSRSCQKSSASSTSAGVEAHVSKFDTTFFLSVVQFSSPIGPSCVPCSGRMLSSRVRVSVAWWNLVFLTLASVNSASVRFAFDKSARSRVAPYSEAPTSRESAGPRSASRRFAPVKFADIMSADDSTAFRRFAPCRSAPLRSAEFRLGGTSGLLRGSRPIT